MFRKMNESFQVNLVLLVAPNKISKAFLHLCLKKSLCPANALRNVSMSFKSDLVEVLDLQFPRVPFDLFRVGAS